MNIKENITVNCRSVIDYIPKLYKFSIEHRPYTSFLIVDEGEYIYETAYEQTVVKKGDVLFLPFGTAYSYTIPNKNTHTRQVTFDIFPESANSLFEQKLTVLSPSVGEKIISSFPRVLEAFQKNTLSSRLRVSSYILSFLSFLTEHNEETHYSKTILPAIEYIEKNYNLNFSITKLSKLCNISDSQLRRYFAKELKMSPLKYKNKIRCENACRLLEEAELNISEISEIMQFNTPYSFSKFFKNEIGISPKKYADLSKTPK